MASQSGNLLKFPHKPSADSKWVKYLRYFASEGGRLASFRIVGGISLLTGIGSYAIQTMYIENFIDIFRAYKLGMPIPVPDEVEETVDEVAKFLELSTREAAHLQTFMLSGFDIQSFGSTYSKYKGWIGIPLNYLYTSKDDIDYANFQSTCSDQPIIWSSDEGQKLAETLVLTENEQKFAMARAVLELKNYNYVHGSFVPAFLGGGLYATSHFVNTRFKLLSKSLQLRVLVYFGLSVSAFALYRLLSDGVKCRQIASDDKVISDLGPEMCRAGIDFYRKIRRRNRAFNELTTTDTYAKNGDEALGFLQLPLFQFPMSERQKILQFRLDEYKEKTDQEQKPTENAEKSAESK